MIMTAKKEIYTLDEAFVFALTICDDDEDAIKAVEIIRGCDEDSIIDDVQSFKIAFVANQTEGFLRAINEVERKLFNLVDERYFYSLVSVNDIGIKKENSGCCDCCGSHAITYN